MSLSYTLNTIDELGNANITITIDEIDYTQDLCNLPLTIKEFENKVIDYAKNYAEEIRAIDEEKVVSKIPPEIKKILDVKHSIE